MSARPLPDPTVGGADARVAADSPTRIAAAIFVGVVGSVVFIVLPVLMGVMAQSAGFDDAQIARLASAQMAGMFLASFAAMAVIPRWGWQRPASSAAVILVLCHLGSAATTSGALLALQALAGFAGGMMIALSLAALGQTSKTDRNYGFWISAQITLGIIGTFALPAAARAAGAGAAFVVLALLSLATLFAIPMIGAPEAKLVDRSERTWGGFTGAGVTSLIAAFCFGVGIMALWTFLERIARHNGLTEGATATVMTAVLLSSLAGALLASQLADRVGRLRPLACALAVMLLLLPWLADAVDPLAFAGAAVLFAAAWNFSVPYQLATTAAYDPRGVLIVLYVSAVKGGYMVAPAIAAPLLTGAGYTPVFWIAAAGLAASLVFYAAANRLGRDR